MAFAFNESANHSTPLPYLSCLVPGVSMEIQETLRFITNSVLRPLSLTLAFMSFIANCLLLVVVARMKTRTHPSFILLCSLSVSDIMWAAICFYREVRVAMHIHHCPQSREEETYLSIWCLFTTLNSLAIISNDRYRAVNKPRWYFNHMTMSRALKEALIGWLSSATTVLIVYVVVNFLPEKVKFINNMIAVIFCVACIFTIIASYIGIFVAIRRHRKSTTAQDGIRQSVAALNREKKLAFTVGFILVTLVFTFLPALASPIVLTLVGYKSKAPFRSLIFLFINLNGLLNPVINCGRNEAIQGSLRRLFGCQRRVRRVSSAAVVDICSIGENTSRREDNVHMETET